MARSPLAEALNETIKSNNPTLLDLLSAKGKNIFFPTKGILGQTAEAKDAKINATIGTAFEEDGSPLCLECLEDMVSVPSEAFLYAPSYGMPGLRSIWKEMLYEKNPSLKGKSISNPVVTNALTHALSVAGYLFIDEGESIIIPDMYWGNYNLIFSQAFGSKYTIYETFVDGGFNVKGLEEKLAEEGEKKIVLINFPNNPTGYTATADEAKAIKDVILQAAQNGKKVVVLLDDAYFGLVYEDGVYMESLFAELADLHENVVAVKLDGPTKEDYVWGFRVGFITFGMKGATEDVYKALEQKAGGMVRGNISNASKLSQQLLLNAYKHENYKTEKNNKYTILKNRYKKIMEIFGAHPEYKESFEPMPFNSGYFMCVKPVGVEAEAVRKELLANHSTGVIVQAGVVRLAFSAVPTDQLDALFTNVHAAIKALQK